LADRQFTTLEAAVFQTVAIAKLGWKTTDFAKRDAGPSRLFLGGVPFRSDAWADVADADIDDTHRFVRCQDPAGNGDTIPGMRTSFIGNAPVIEEQRNSTAIIAETIRWFLCVKTLTRLQPLSDVSVAACTTY
jgi:hypothetical protein